MMRLLLVACAIGILTIGCLRTDGRSQSSSATGTSTATVAPSSAMAGPLLQDAYPLYAGVTWNTAVAKTMSLTGPGGAVKLTGFQVVTAPMSSLSQSTKFENLYKQRLQSRGWHSYLSASGAGSMTQAYQKGNNFIVVNFRTVFKGGGANAPEQCPCSTTFTVFTGTK